MDLNDIVARIQTDVRGLQDIKGAPDQPPETIAYFPFAVCYPYRGSIANADFGEKDSTHDIALEVHIANQSLPRAIEQATPYVELVPDALFGDTTLNGGETYITGISYEFAPLGWGETGTIGYRFLVTVVTGSAT